jgi:hypothetical protein
MRGKGAGCQIIGEYERIRVGVRPANLSRELSRELIWWEWRWNLWNECETRGNVKNSPVATRDRSLADMFGRGDYYQPAPTSFCIVGRFLAAASLF